MTHQPTNLCHLVGWLIALSSVWSMSACHANRPTIPSSSVAERPTVPAVAIQVFDAALDIDDARWGQLPSYPMSLSQDRTQRGHHVRASGTFQVASNSKHLYLRTDFEDSDLVSFAESDGGKIYQQGDVSEWFIGLGPCPDGQPMPYLELHIVPTGHMAAFRIIRPGLVEELDPQIFDAEVKINGTLNDASDRDQGWTAWFSIERDRLAELIGLETPLPEAGLRMLVARYNYSHFLPYDRHGVGGPELSMWPIQPRTAFHLRPYHAQLMLER